VADIKYLAILKAKGAEFEALKVMTADDKAAMTPLIEVLPEQVHDVASLTTTIAKNWTGVSPLLLDFSLTDQGAAATALTAASKTLLTEIRSLVPVVTAAAAPPFILAAANAAKKHGRGAAIRLSSGEFTDAARATAVLDSAARGLGLDPKDVDVILDLQSFTQAHEALLASGAAAAIRNLPKVTEWRSVTLAGSSFPAVVTAAAGTSIKRIRRAEWAVWRLVAAEKLPRLPDYGDYGVENPGLIEFDPKFMTPSANLRYTTDDDWIVFKGRSTKKGGKVQFITFCKTLSTMPEYCGENFSWGDGQIMLRARGGGGPGNPKTWRQIGVSHHIAFVIDRLANFSAS
jgi:hypothetical protein